MHKRASVMSVDLPHPHDADTLGVVQTQGSEILSCILPAMQRSYGWSVHQYCSEKRKQILMNNNKII
jgi:hypothetical protein